MTQSGRSLYFRIYPNGKANDKRLGTSGGHSGPVVIEGAQTEENRQQGTLPLGQLNLTTEVENYPGFPSGHLGEYLRTSLGEDKTKYMSKPTGEGVTGPELMELMRQQAVNFGTRVKTDDIVEVDFSSHSFKLRSLAGDEVEALSVIVATGARANYLGLESEDRFKNMGVSACAVCDGALPRFRDKPLLQARKMDLDDVLHRFRIGELDEVEEAAPQERVG